MSLCLSKQQRHMQMLLLPAGGAVPGRDLLQDATIHRSSVAESGGQIRQSIWPSRGSRQAPIAGLPTFC